MTVPQISTSRELSDGFTRSIQDLRELAQEFRELTIYLRENRERRTYRELMREELRKFAEEKAAEELRRYGPVRREGERMRAQLMREALIKEDN